jgi:hypothetical protein
VSNAGHERPGKSRVCPHCQATILESASICPACRHYLRFDPHAAQGGLSSFSPLRVEGTISHPSRGGPLEYSVLLAIHDEGGKEIARQVVGVGALRSGEERTFVLAVEVFTSRAANMEAHSPTHGHRDEPALNKQLVAAASTPKPGDAAIS